MNQTAYQKDKYWNTTHLIVLALLTCLCYWPVVLGIFSAKNDNITQFLPVRFHVSEALRSGNLPLWTPYMYLGYPIHGDMQGGAWNPAVWLLSLFGRYNLTSLHTEIAIYAFLAGAGMYRLLGIKGMSPIIRLVGASTYLMCGYITDVGGSNLPFLAGAAYIPFVFAYCYHLFTTPSWPHVFKSTIACGLLFVSAYPSFFITTIYVLFAAAAVIIARNILRKDYNTLRRLLLFQLAMTGLFLALCAPAILSYWHILPLYQRGGGVSLIRALENGFHPRCSLSFILPSVPIKDPATAATDLISKNGYFNTFTLIFLSCYAGVRRTVLHHFTAAGIVFFFLFSLGSYTPVRNWCYEFLPLMDTFRHPSNARLFVITGGIFLGMTVYQDFYSGTLRRKYPLTASILLAAITLTFLLSSIPYISITEKVHYLFHQETNTRAALKHFFDSMSYSDHVFLNSTIQLLFLGGLLALFRKPKKHKWVTTLFLANSFLFAQLTIPYTFASQRPPEDINQFIRNIPQGFPAPDPANSIGQNSADALSDYKLIGIKSFYNKNIATCDLILTPTFLTMMENANADSFVRSTSLANPYVYFANSITTVSKLPYNNSVKGWMLTDDSSLLSLSEHVSAQVELSKLWNNGFSFITTTDGEAMLCLQQLLTPGWQSCIDGQETEIISANKAFLAVKVPEGKHEITFRYCPHGISAALWLSLITFAAVLMLLLKRQMPWR